MVLNAQEVGTSGCSFHQRHFFFAVEAVSESENCIKAWNLTVLSKIVILCTNPKAENTKCKTFMLTRCASAPSIVTNSTFPATSADVLLFTIPYQLEYCK